MFVVAFSCVADSVVPYVMSLGVFQVRPADAAIMSAVVVGCVTE